MAFKMKYSIVQRYIPVNTKRRSGLKNRGIEFIVAHDTGNDGSTVAGNVNYYTNSANVESASAHTFIDDEVIVECVPLTEKAWHVLYNVTTDNDLYGFDSNDHAIGVELCYSNKKGSINNQEAYKRYVWYMAYLCNKYGLNPLARISGHNELDPTRKSDPYKNALKIMGISKTQFLNDVATELKDCTTIESPAKTEISEDDEPMNLDKWAIDMLVKNLTDFKAKGFFTDEAWITKAKNGTLTASELAFLNTILIARAVKK
ncbi:peptidoglycan recognition protein family protein [Paenibacillus silvae]|uniref:peptidoglycan recognition protein family protein n=2 Tax=Paenibacillus silvae TaxID=1325358 RepID=UPI002003788B|nr:peptidoglycan recognition family protein [Paenibacillus silvae]MCK6076944.1 N-acetylmuramoyl-L-alanine amidase [Paenibacillus silvae]MCK6152704.1 N-acetylmuramoyl-L-alanine amidase [Paenibacillus silvae]MCK6269549.1 N-acetylmuramoyl-L-alanine amidase [Paenibacillus silvae]